MNNSEFNTDHLKATIANLKGTTQSAKIANPSVQKVVNTVAGNKSGTVRPTTKPKSK